MTVYIDLVFILNFIYDFLLLITVSITLKRNSKINRIIIASLFGSLSTILLFFKINKIILLILKIIIAFIMSLIAFNYKNINYFISNNIYLYMCSVILAGFIYYLKTEFNNLSYVMVLIISPLILYLYIKEQKKLKRIINYSKKVIIIFKNKKKIELNGFIDTGNRLKDPITNKYIILINKNRIKGIYNIRSPIYVPIKTINKNSLLECISIKNIIIDNKIYSNYLIGLSNSFNRFEEYDCILNYHLLEE